MFLLSVQLMSGRLVISVLLRVRLQSIVTFARRHLKCVINKQNLLCDNLLSDEVIGVAWWGGGMSASCKPLVQLFARVGNGWPHSLTVISATTRLV